MKHTVTDEWFDNDHPNPLHPIGVIIDPIKRRVEIHPYTSKDNANTQYYYVGDTFTLEDTR